MPMSTRLATIKRIQEIYEKLDRQTLVSEELEELVQLSSELYEKALILRFKAAEERVFENKKTEETPKEEIVVQVEQKAEIKELEFDIFEPMREVKEAEVVEEQEESLVEPEKIEPEEIIEPLVDNIEIVVEEEKVKELNTMNSDAVPAEWSGYFKKVLDEHSSGLQTKLNALSGSFGLNERILYINELFDGNAEEFSEAIQQMDKMGDWSSCAAKLSDIGTQRNWDKEDDVTGEFIIHVKRKYV